jgi:hypothetical protein
VAVGRSRYGPEGDTTGVHDHRALDALLSSIYGAFTRLLTTAGSLCDTAIYSNIGKIQTDHPIIAIEHYLA